MQTLLEGPMLLKKSFLHPKPQFLIIQNLWNIEPVSCMYAQSTIEIIVKKKFSLCPIKIDEREDYSWAREYLLSKVFFN